MNVSQQIYSPNTRRVYDTQYRQFVQWCEARGKPCDTRTLCAYLEARAERGAASATLQLIPTAIRASTREAGLPDPADHKSVRRVLRRARHLRKGDRRHATGLTHRDMLKIKPFATPKQWALLKLMHNCLLRRSEASAARWRDLSPEPDGTGLFTVPHSKTDQEGKGAVLFVGRDTMAVLKVIRPGFTLPVGEKIFSWCPYSICCNIARLAEQAGLKGDYSGLSPRVGMVQDLSRLGASLVEIQHAGRWQSPKMLGHYIRSISTGCSAVAKYQKFL